jgi:hypothetical protein
MRKSYLCLPGGLILFFSVTLSAQKNNKISFGNYPKLSLRTSLHSYFDYDAGVMLGINYRWTEKFSITVDPTFIFYNGVAINEEEKFFPSGFKIRADVRYHFPHKRKNGTDFFIAPELHLKYVRTKKQGDFGINCQNGQCNYTQQAVYTEVKNEIGGILKLGAIVPLSFLNSDRWFFEFYSGFGVKRQKFKETDLPTGGSFINPPNRSNFVNFGATNDRNTIFAPLFPVGIKVVFVLM